MFDTALFIDILPLLLRGAWVSLQIAILSCAIGFSLGTLLGLAQSGHDRIARALVHLYVTLFRGTPMLVQIMCVYFILPQLGITVPAFWAAVVAIGLNSAAYISQTIRSGIASVPKGQLEAAKVLGLSKITTMRYIILPQAIRVIMPALGNEFITLIKDSSLASTIGVMELSKEGSIIRNQTYDAITTFAGVALIYLLMTTTLSLLMNKLEKRMNRHVSH